MLDVRAALSNGTLLHPPGFHVVGFTAMPHANLYLIFLGVVYVLTVLFNCFILCIICLDHKLHSPKFLAVANLAVVDILFSSCVIPGMLKIFLFKDPFVPFNLCLVQMGVYYCCSSLESFSLAVLAYDRLIAICFPLRQHAINTNTYMLCILGSIWAFCLITITFSTSIMKRLSFCDSVQVYSYFCDYSPVYRLACNDYSLQWATAVSLSIVILFGPLSLIIMSYISILIAVFRMKNAGNRYKALATCTEHLILVAIFYLPTLTLYIIGFFLYRLDPDIRMVTLSMSACMPLCLNPVVYSLKTKEIKSKAQILFCKSTVRPEEKL
ncbi:odorant receptor 108-3 [Clupea harengus]|uniref:Odorant receptor 108-3 n=1 Tax=Clupea harengus TaxID=7950 RepID=A0A6P3VHW3_CLUHA|nr:odorant receptor 108-3 [Clupea harengus]